MRFFDLILVSALIVIAFLTSQSRAMDIYNFANTVPLSYTKIVNNAKVSGLTVTATVVNATTNATLLASTSLPEISSGAGIYTYNWTPPLSGDTLCQVTYTVGTTIYKEFIFLTNDGFGGRAQ